MRRKDLLKTLRNLAKDAGHDLVLVREGSDHTIYEIGGYRFPVPRHTEINEYTAQGILKRAKEEG